MVRVLAIAVLLAIPIAGCGISEDEARELLARAERAGQEESYRGIVVRRFSLDDDERTTTVRVHHGPEGTRYEADQPGGPATWSHFSPTRPDIHWLREPDLLLESYRLVREGEEAVAGRAATRYRLTARRPERPSRRFWLDDGTGLMLRDEGLDADGRVYESMQFEMIEFGGEDPMPDLETADEPTPERAVALRTVADDALAAAVGFEPFRPSILPEGFRLLRSHVRDENRRGAILVYGDGLAQFVISERLAATPDAEPRSEDAEVEVRREVRRSEIRLGLRLEDVQVDVSSRTIGWELLRDVVASLSRGGQV